MDMTIAGLTKMADKITEDDKKNMMVHCGKNAGISQTRETFVTDAVQDEEKAMKRFKNTMKRGHFSVADHAHVEIVFENASRMMAMVLNSLQCYATTEKSGRYTKMAGDTKEQRALYDKWEKIFKARILELYPDYNDAFLNRMLEHHGYLERVKDGAFTGDACPEAQALVERAMAQENLPVNTRSQENARYVLSVFTKSTAFGYTASLSQWNYIHDWCQKFTGQFTHDGASWVKHAKTGDIPATPFEAGIIGELLELQGFLRENLYVENLRDHKNRQIDLLAAYTDESHPMAKFDVSDGRINFSYTVGYEGSFILLSHLHRHRTIKYWMCQPDKPGFYVPKPIRGTAYEQEWLDDLNAIKGLCPQGMLVKIVEAGTLETFALKASERLCGCAMSETMENVKNLGERFASYYESELSTGVERAYIETFYDSKKKRLKTKAAITDGCTEGCYFTCKRALDRMA